ncbi:NAD(P)-binding domain-containing protein [Kitasatospora sp. NPDC059811]|uniref:imine reductase family protein n=1 Tax=Streptomycetaceae TaxID=2062 RepID=UPI0009A06892|nr:NAD(P)-binding domain-containing protein [Streptomyces sp. MJM8645]
MPTERSSATPSSPTAVAVLGLGPMGRALARALLAAGHPVTVWNRTPGRDAELRALGARSAATAAEAVAAGPLALLCVRDQAAARAVLDSAGAALRGRTLVNATSVTPDDARANAARAGAGGFRLLNAAILTPTPTIGRPEGAVLLSGDAGAFAAHEAALRTLGGGVRLLDSGDPGRAAAFDAALLDLFWTTVHGYLHALALARAEGIGGTELAPYAQGLPRLLPALIDEFAQRADQGSHPGDRSSVASAEAGLAHVAHTARARGLDTAVLDAALAVTRRAVAAGHGPDGVSALVETVGTIKTVGAVETAGAAGAAGTAGGVGNAEG